MLLVRLYNIELEIQLWTLWSAIEILEFSSIRGCNFIIMLGRLFIEQLDLQTVSCDQQ